MAESTAPVNIPVSRRSQSALGRKRDHRQAASDEQQRRLAAENGGARLPHHALGECDLPSSGKKLPEGSLHRRLCRQMVSCLFFRLDVAQSSVQEDMFVYFDGADGKRKQRAPDVFVIHDLPMRDRQSYIVWKEGKPPDFALEIVSSSTWRTDVGKKPKDYAVMGVKEFFLFDPHEHVKPRLRCGRLNANGEYDPLPVERLPEGHLGVYSEVLKLHVCHSDPWQMANQLRLYDPAAEIFVDREITGGRVEGAEGGANIQHELAPAAARARQVAEAKAVAAEAKAQTAQANVQIAQAKARTERANAQTARAKFRTERAKAQTAQAKEQIAQAKVQIAQAQARAAKDELQAATAEVAQLKALLRAHGIFSDLP